MSKDFLTVEHLDGVSTCILTMLDVDYSADTPITSEEMIDDVAFKLKLLDDKVYESGFLREFRKELQDHINLIKGLKKKDEDQKRLAKHLIKSMYTLANTNIGFVIMDVNLPRTIPVEKMHKTCIDILKNVYALRQEMTRKPDSVITRIKSFLVNVLYRKDES